MPYHRIRIERQVYWCQAIQCGWNARRHFL